MPKVNIDFADSTYEVLRNLAKEQGKSKGEVIRDVLALGRHMSNKTPKNERTQMYEVKDYLLIEDGKIIAVSGNSEFEDIGDQPIHINPSKERVIAVVIEVDEAVIPDCKHPEHAEDETCFRRQLPCSLKCKCCMGKYLNPA